MCYFLGRQKYNFEIDNDELTTILSNEHLCTSFAKLATDLDVLEPKSPEDIYKSHLEEHGRGINTGAPIDSA